MGNDTETTGASQVGPRRGWREDGTVDIDAVRAGTHDVNDSAAVFDSLCDEVEEARAEVEQNLAERELLRTVLEALDLPRPASHIDWRRARQQLSEHRADDVRRGLRGYLDGSASVALTLDWIRQSVKDYPVDYQVQGGAR